MAPKQREEIVEYVTSWEQRGIEIGLKQGRDEGRQEGLQEGLQEGVGALQGVLLDVLATRFGPVGEATAAKVRKVDSLPRLRKLIQKALTAKSIAGLRL